MHFSYIVFLKTFNDKRYIVAANNFPLQRWSVLIIERMRDMIDNFNLENQAFVSVQKTIGLLKMTVYQSVCNF